MSYCRDFGKDKIVFLNEQDLEKPSKVKLGEDDSEEERGLMLPNGEINWNCPCLGGLGTGPCAYQFREAFNCFNATSDDEKAQCVERFQNMQECLVKFPELYPFAQKDPEENEEESEAGNDGGEDTGASEPTSDLTLSTNSTDKVEINSNKKEEPL